MRPEYRAPDHALSFLRGAGMWYNQMVICNEAEFAYERAGVCGYRKQAMRPVLALRYCKGDVV